MYWCWNRLVTVIASRNVFESSSSAKLCLSFVMFDFVSVSGRSLPQQCERAMYSAPKGISVFSHTRTEWWSTGPTSITRVGMKSFGGRWHSACSARHCWCCAWRKSSALSSPVLFDLTVPVCSVCSIDHRQQHPGYADVFLRPLHCSIPSLATLYLPRLKTMAAECSL